MSAVIEWTRVLSKCSPQVRKSIMNIRGRHEELKRQIFDYKQSMPTISLDYYREKLGPQHADFLNEMQKEIAHWKAPISDKDVKSQLEDLQVERSTKMIEAEKFLSDLETEISKLKNSLELIKKSKPIDDLTVDDVYATNPEFKEIVDNCIRNENWAVEDDDQGVKDTRKEHNKIE